MSKDKETNTAAEEANPDSRASREKKQNAAIKTYNEYFNVFIENCIINDKGFLTVESDTLFTTENIENTAAFLRKVHEINTPIKEDNKKIKNKNDKKEIYSISRIFNGAIFGEAKIKDEFDQENTLKILLHCDWLMYLCSEKQNKRSEGLIQDYYKEGIDNYFETDQKWALGTTYSGCSPDSMLFILELIKQIKEDIKESIEDIKKSIEETKKSIEEIKKSIEDKIKNEDWKKSLKWEDSNEKAISYNVIVNILLFLCNDNYYLPIAAQEKKELICERLYKLVISEDFGSSTDINEKLYEIREKIRETQEQLKDKDNPFWHHTIRPLWDETELEGGLSIESLLEYKKAMILYGPPGTSKSYQARCIAENIIAKNLGWSKYEKLENTFKTNIHCLQMHPNYSYEDFIIGKSIENNTVVVKPGKLMQIIASIGDDTPHFIILDEINRVDISRVFGELFTAMEKSYRGNDSHDHSNLQQLMEEKDRLQAWDGVELSASANDLPNDLQDKYKNFTDKNGNLFLKIPQNLYFIGTMNMIDFSLEQIDFALRRRFLWKLSTYDPNRLTNIIFEKKKGCSIKYDDFVKSCTNLNEKIKNLGDTYLIGHAFFSEIVDIYEKVNDLGLAKKILWEISIEPTLEAYCGTMDYNTKTDFINECKKAFMPDK